MVYPKWQFNFLKFSVSFYMILHFLFLYINNPFTPIIHTDWILLVGIFSALGIPFEKTRRLGSLITWFCLFFFFRQNIFLYGINHDYIGWLLLALVCIDAPFDGKMSKIIFWGSWLILSLGYFASGFSKIVMTDFWTTGRAGEIAFSVFSRFDVMSAQSLYFMTYVVLFLELLFPLGCLNRFSRLVFYTGMVFVHLTLFIFTYCTEISASVLIWHILIFDQRWLSKSYWRKAS